MLYAHGHDDDDDDHDIEIIARPGRAYYSQICYVAALRCP